MKICANCKKTKTLEEYYKNRSKTLGVHNSCKECEHIRDVKRKDYLINYRKTHRKSIREGFKKWLSNNREQYRANRIVVDRIRYGSLKREACLMCGAENAEAHHQDYTKPLEIIWLCKIHHGEVKRKNITFPMITV